MTGLCALCRAVDERLAEERHLYDIQLFSSTSFVVIPAVGSVAPGHVMVVSRKHFLNLASMGASGVQEYNALIESIALRQGYSRGDLLEAEHGSSEHESAGACITHVHINVIPGFGPMVDFLDGKLPQLEIDDGLEMLNASAAPYILSRGAGLVRLYKAHAVPSQFIRRVLFAKIGRDDWDWVVFPHIEAVKETLRLWGREPHV